MKGSNPVIWFEVMGKKGKELQDFYKKAFDWSINASNPMNYGVVEVDEKSDGIGGGVSQGPKGENLVTFYIQVKNLDSSLEKIKTLGGKTISKPMEVPGFGITIAHFQDPAGNVVGLIKDQK